MSVLAGEIIAGAQELANLVDADFIADATWLRWLNQSIAALFKKVVVFNPDFFLSHVDYSTDGTTNNPFTPPIDFGIARGVTKDPTLQRTRRSLRSYNFSSRDQQQDLAYRVDGGLVYLESSTPLAANLRLWYDAKPVTLGVPPVPNLIVKAATAADFPPPGAAIWSSVEGPSSGVFNTLAMSGSGGGSGGSVLVDGISIGVGDLAGEVVLFRHGAASITPGFTARLVATAALPGTVVTFRSASPTFTQLSRAPGDAGYVNLVIDGVTVSAGTGAGDGDLILVAGQVDQVSNGLYRCDLNDVTNGWLLRRALMPGMVAPPTPLSGDYNVAYAAATRIVLITDGTIHFNQQFVGSPIGASVDVTAQTFAAGIVPGKGVWVCQGRGEDGRLRFGRYLVPPVDLTDHGAADPNIIGKGFIVQPTLGTVNAGALFSSTGAADAGGDWFVGQSDVSFDPITTTNVLPALYEPFVEWLEVRTAIRGLGKEENDVTKELKERLGDTDPPTGLTAELRDYVDALNSGDGIAITDVENDSNRSPWGWPWDR